MAARKPTLFRRSLLPVRPMPAEAISKLTFMDMQLVMKSERPNLDRLPLPPKADHCGLR